MNIGPYLVLGPCGEGTFGAVFQAKDQRNGRIVALKILKDRALIERFRREVQNLYEQINNQFIARLLDHSLDTEPAYIAIEYCGGGSLRQWVGRGMPWQDVVRAMQHAAIGLSAIHSTGGFHRDIKPDNVLIWLSDDGQGSVIKLCDLGIGRGAANFLKPHATTNAMGTEGYMAPELRAGAAFSASADIYSLGVTALELLTGVRSIAALDSVVCPEPVKKLVRSMLSPKRHARPTASSVASDLQKIRGRQSWPLQAPAPPPTDWGGVALLGMAALFVAAVASG